MFTVGGAAFTVGESTQNCYGPHGPKIWKKITRAWQNNCTEKEEWVRFTVGGATFTVGAAGFTVGGAEFTVIVAEFTVGGACLQ